MPGPAPDLRPLTWHDYRDLPEHGPRYQLIQGELFMAPAPNLPHQIISRNIEMVLVDWLEAHPDGLVLDAPLDVYLTELNVFQPDIVLILNAHRSIVKRDGIHGAPDLVVEILSPSTAKWDLGTKKRLYAVTGVSELWIIDPDTRRTSVYRLKESIDAPAATYEVPATFSTPLLPGLALKTQTFFKDLDWISEA